MTKTLRILKVTLCLVVAVLFLILVGNLWFEEQDFTEVSTQAIRGVLVPAPIQSIFNALGGCKHKQLPFII